MSLGSVGTRRTVYLSEEDQPNIPNQTVPPLLVYNKISTTIGGEVSSKNAQKNNEQSNAQQEDRVLDQKKDTSKENAVWYEYGCV